MILKLYGTNTSLATRPVDDVLTAVRPGTSYRYSGLMDEIDRYDVNLCSSHNWQAVGLQESRRWLDQLEKGLKTVTTLLLLRVFLF